MKMENNNEEKSVAPIERFIVAEITKNWDEQTTPVENLLSNQFESVINLNYERGYKLVDWKINSIINHSTNVFTETIIAVFEKM